MSPRGDRLALLSVPVLLYLTAASTVGIQQVNLAFVTGLLLSAAPLGLLVYPNRVWVFVLLPFVGLEAILVGAIASGLLLVAPWDALLGGILCGLPIGVLGALLAGVGDAPVRFLLLIAVIWEGLGLRASGGSSPGGVGHNFLQSELAQLGGLGAWSGGSPSPILPLTSVNDPVFLGLAVVAIGGALLAMLRGPDRAAVPPAQRDHDLWLVVAALGAGALFEVLALGAPRFALLGMALAVVVVVGVALLLASPRRTVWLGRLARRLARDRSASNLPD